MRSNNTTVIQKYIARSKRSLNWYAVQLGYSLKDGHSSFNLIAKGERVPHARKRRELSIIFGVNVGDLWEFDQATGAIIAKRVEEEK